MKEGFCKSPLSAKDEFKAVTGQNFTVICLSAFGYVDNGSERLDEVEMDRMWLHVSRVFGNMRRPTLNKKIKNKKYKI